MGCCNSKKSKGDSSVEEIKKEYSWDQRKVIDLSKFMFKDIENQTVVKKPGEVNGEQFFIENCEHSNLFLLDDIASVTVDNCVGCQIITGPIRGSIFLRNCQDCKVSVACQQFRARDCRKVDVFLLCTTQPIIEATSNIRFGCYQLFYPELSSQFEASRISVFNNSWSNIHDFSPDSDTKNWTILPGNVTAETVFDLTLPQSTEEENFIKLSTKSCDSVVPLSYGNSFKFSNESCFAVVFHSNSYCKDAFQIINGMANEEFGLIQSKEITLSELEVKRIFSDGAVQFSKFAIAGPVIGLEFNGENSIATCSRITQEIGSEKIYVSSSIENSNREIEQFYNFCEMQMNV